MSEGLMMKKSILYLMLIAAWTGIIYGERYASAIANVKIKNEGNIPITVGTHSGQKTIQAGYALPLQMQRGQAYEIVARSAKNKRELGRTSAKFTSGEYIVTMEPSADSSDPNAVNVLLTKKKIEEKNQRYKRTIIEEFE